jgi:Fe-S-cluster containining protein
MTTTTTSINWLAPRQEFQQSILDMVETCRKNDSVISVPIEMHPGSEFLNDLSLILSMIECSACDALCCRTNHGTQGIPLTDKEAAWLEKDFSIQSTCIAVGFKQMDVPCKLLNRNRCAIYQSRPQVCCVYPFQPGGRDAAGQELFALDSQCPSARTVAVKIYLRKYEILNLFKR